MVFVCNGQFSFYNNRYKDKTLPVSYILGTQPGSFHFSVNQPLTLFGLDFTPYGLHLITGLSVNEFTGSFCALDVIFGSEGKILTDRILDTKESRKKILLIESFLKRVFLIRHKPLPAIINAVDLVNNIHGRISMSALSSSIETGERQLERIFNRAIGLNPKLFAQIIRFNYIFKLLKECPEIDFQDIAFICGYYDQNHLIKEFKQFSGVTPSEYFKNKHELANLFLNE
jgi:AraC-like DNA-binding protein